MPIAFAAWMSAFLPSQSTCTKRKKQKTNPENWPARKAQGTEKMANQNLETAQRKMNRKWWELVRGEKKLQKYCRDKIAKKAKRIQKQRGKKYQRAFKKKLKKLQSDVPFSERICNAIIKLWQERQCSRDGFRTSEHGVHNVQNTEHILEDLWHWKTCRMALCSSALLQLLMMLILMLWCRVCTVIASIHSHSISLTPWSWTDFHFF